jgi:hypothetical protein
MVVGILQKKQKIKKLRLELLQLKGIIKKKLIKVTELEAIDIQ